MKVTTRFLCKLLLLLLCSFQSACDSFLEIDLPSSQLTGETVFMDSASARAALGDIYAELRDHVLVTGAPNGLGVLMGLYSDELEFYGSTSLTGFEYYNHTLVPTDPSIATLWNNSYKLIHAANSIYERVGNSQTLSILDSDQLKGEALFLRAFIHFQLTQLFGNIPYITTTNYLENSKIIKTQQETIFKKIVSDLQLAKQHMHDNGSPVVRTQVHSGAISTLLARCFLAQKDWERAESETSKIIDNTIHYNWEEDLTKVFLKESTGIIWQLAPQLEGNGTQEARSFVFSSGPPPNLSLTEGLVQSFEPGDSRRLHWVTEVADGDNKWYHANKYRQNDQLDVSREYSIVFRLGEIYLIRAEARSRQGNLEGAKADLDKIRERAKLPKTTVTTQESLLEAIFQERRIELFTEHGHRWFDLIRFGRADMELSTIKPSWRATDELLPLPEPELLLNPNLYPQNDGY